MSNWLQAQLNVAQNLLESVDRTISKTVGINNAEGASDPDQQDVQGLPLSQGASHEDEYVPGPFARFDQAPLGAATSASTSTAPFALPPHASSSDRPPPAATPFTIRQSGPFDSPSFASTAGSTSTAAASGPPPLPWTAPSTSGTAAITPAPAPFPPSNPAPLTVVVGGAPPPAPASHSYSPSPLSFASTQPSEPSPASSQPTHSPFQPPSAPAPAAPTPAAAAASPAPPAPASASSPATAAAAPVPSSSPAASAAAPRQKPDDPAPSIAAAARPCPPTAPAAGASARTSAGSHPAGPSEQQKQQQHVAVSSSAVPATSAGGPAAAAAAAGANAGAVKLVEQLRKRLEVAAAENEQLEEMLKREEARAAAEAAAARKLAEELSALQDARAQSEAALQSQLAAQQLASRDLTARLEASTRQVVKLEARVAGLEETARQVEESRSGLEGGMLEALKSQLAAAEQRLDGEVRAHQATKAAAMSRANELEGRLEESAGALADMQRALEEAGAKGRDLEDQLALLESERKRLEASLHQQQQQQGRSGGGASSTGGSVDAALVDALRADLSVQQRACAAAEQGRAAAEARAAALAAEAEGLRAEVDKHAARGDMSQLEARLREVTDMLYLKQNQLERLSADKAAQQLRLERELQQARDEALSLRKAAAQHDMGVGSMGVDGDDVIPMDALGAPYQRLAQNNSVGKAVKAAARFVDTTASSAAFFLRQYPLARLLIFGYLLFIHFYVYYLMARLQGMAVRMESMADAAAGAGLLAAAGAAAGGQHQQLQIGTANDSAGATHPHA